LSLKFPTIYHVLVYSSNPSCYVLLIFNMEIKINAIIAQTANCFSWNSCWVLNYTFKPFNTKRYKGEMQ